MLKLKTTEGTQKVCRVNFRSSIEEDLMQYKIEFADPFTRKAVVIEASYPEPGKLNAQRAIFLLEELQHHLHWVLAKEKPDAAHLQNGCIWRWQCRQTEVLIASVKRYLSDLLWEEFQANCPEDPEGMMAEYPSIGLLTTDDHLLYWYVNDCFAQDMDSETIDQIRVDLEYQMFGWMDELDELSENGVNVESAAACQLQKFRCEVKQTQIDQLAHMAGMDKACGQKRKLEDSCDLPIGIIWDQSPQWLGMPELIEQIEKMKLCMKQAESFPDDLVTKVQTKHNELLDELNRRMVAIVCSCIGCDESEQAVLEHAQQLGDIPYPVCFLEGGALKQPEDVIHCWYLNERFPFKMDLEQLDRVESVVKQQLDTLEEAYDVYNNDGERSLWMLSCELKERQLDQIREEIYAAEAALVYWDENNDLLKQIREEMDSAESELEYWNRNNDLLNQI